MQTFIIIITNVFNFEKKIIIVSITWLAPIKLGGKTILVNLNNFSISEACADNSSFLACTGMNVWLISLKIPLNLQYLITFLICWFLQRAWIRRKHGHSWDGVRSLQFLFFTGVFFFKLTLFSLSVLFCFLSFIILLLFINSITVILKNRFCSLCSIFYTFAMWWKFYDLIFLYLCVMILFLYFTIGHSWGLP